ncbi:WXG100 family type VII secretion target [Propionibacteriaceae bacterium Y2011]
MAGNSQVDRAEMAKAAGQIDQALGTISGIQRDLGSNVQGLMATWKGNAATAFLRAFSEFDGQFAIVLSELEGIHGKLTDSQSQYSQNESSQEESTQAILNALNG